MPKIDSQMLQIHERCTQSNSDGGKKVSEQETRLLIQRAEEINTTSHSSFHKESRKGNKYLLKLVNTYPEDFSPDSQKMINKYITTGQMPSVSVMPSSPAATRREILPAAVAFSPSTDGHAHHTHSHSPEVPRNSPAEAPRPDSEPKKRRRRGAGEVSSPTGSSGLTANAGASGVGMGAGAGVIGAGAPLAPAIPPRTPVSPSGQPAAIGTLPSIPTPTRPIPISTPSIPISTPSVPSAPPASVSPPAIPSTPPAATNPPRTPLTPPAVTPPASNPIASPTSPISMPGGAVGTIGPNGKIILDFQAQHKTCAWHWFPLQETTPGGDPINNLYAKDGCLDKLDKVTGGTARQYEYDHNRKAKDAGKQFAWWGHCNNAAEAACILPEPKKSVVMKAKDGSEVKFSKNDIQGLLVLMSSSLVSRVDFRGERFNNPTRDDPNDPKPELFLKVMQEWSADGLPFVLDIDRLEMVWNYPYDQVRIAESDKAPEGFNASSLPRDGSVKYYHIDMSGTGFDAKRRVYECFVQKGANGQVTTSGWIKTPNTHNNPDFMWRPHPIADIMNKDNWVLRGKPSNPMIDPKVIYDIYMKSLA